MADRFDPELVDTFDVLRSEIDWSDAGQVGVTCRYRLLDAAGAVLVACEERFVFPLPAEQVPAPRRAAFEAMIERLAAVAGISYYKLAAPDRVVLHSGTWAPDDVDALRTIFCRGLGEYCFVNGLDPELWPVFEHRCVASVTDRAAAVGLGRGPLVPVGGGKDSCVSVEALRAANLAPTLVTVNRYPVIADVIAQSGLPDLAVRRVLDPQLGALNERGARNGHVPATAIVSLAVAATAVLHGHSAVVMSNERSASEGNVVYRGVEINHQWSKSEQAEEIIRGLVQRVAPDLSYFSLLRPLSELSIARRFAQTCERYFSTFSSCNANFRLDPTRRGDRWCGVCPKCQFVFLALATAVPRDRLIDIFGTDVFASSPIGGFRSLLGLSEWKPFECVGESGECRVAIAMVLAHADWSDHPVLGSLLEELRASGWVPSDEQRNDVLAARPAGSLPAAYTAAIGC